MQPNKKQITVKIKGGLGNQLFCYAVARALALKSNRQCVLDTDSGFKNEKYGRSFRLSNYSIPQEVVLQKGMQKLPIFSKLDRFLPLQHRSYLKEKYIDLEKLVSTNYKKTNLYLDGYWQSEKIFKNDRSTLLKELQANISLSEKDLAVKSQIQTSNSVFVHIRRVRYIHKIGVQYYRTAIEQINNQLEKPVFFLFSDDLDWIRSKQVFKNHEHHFVDHNGEQSELYDLELMRACKHAVIANSSFSWWGAWLIENPDKKIIAPHKTGFALENPEAWQKIEIEFEK